MMNGIFINSVIIMLVVVKLISKQLIGDFMVLFRLIVRIIRVFFIRLININIEKKIVKLVYIFVFNVYLYKEEIEVVSDVIWFMKLNVNDFQM